MEEILKEVKRLDDLSTTFVIRSIIIFAIGVIIAIIWVKSKSDSNVFDFITLTLFTSSIIVCIVGLIISCKIMSDARNLYDETLYEYIEEKDYTLYINGTERDTNKMNIRQLKFRWDRTEVDDEKKEIYITKNCD